jgi:hypothetical protein
MNNPGIAFNDLKRDISTLLCLTRDLLNDTKATQHIRKGMIQEPLYPFLYELGGKDRGENIVFLPSEHRSQAALAFWNAVDMFDEFRKLTALDSQSTSTPRSTSLTGVTSLPSKLTLSSGFQSGTGQGLSHHTFESSVAGSSESWSNQDDLFSSLQPSPSVRDPFASGSVPGSGKGSPLSSGIEMSSGQMSLYDSQITFPAQRQKIVLMQSFAFHLFFMVTRMPYQVLGAQCNDLNYEYMAGGISGLFDVVTQYIEKAAVGLQLWSDETDVASTRLQPRYEQIKKMVQRSLEEVRSEYVPTHVGGEKYSFIQREADQLTRDMRVHLQVADPHIIFIFDFHRKVALLNSRWSSVLNRFETSLSPMELRIFRNEAREFVVMTRSIPNIFTKLYEVAIQAARYHCSRFQLGQQSDKREFTLQLTFIRFLSDRMRTNLEPGNVVHFIKLFVPQDAPYKERLLELHEAGLLTVEDLHAENSSSRASNAGDINDDTELQRALELSKQDTQRETPQDTEYDEEYQMAVALSLSEQEANLSELSKRNSDTMDSESGEKDTLSDQEAGELASHNSDRVDGQFGHKHLSSNQFKEPGNQELKLDISVESDSGHETVDKSLKVASGISHKATLDIIDRLGQNPRFLTFHHEAIKEELVEGFFLRIDIVGRDRVGKTSLARSLLSEMFVKDDKSTKGVDPIEVSVKTAHSWKKSETHGHAMQELCDHFTAKSTVQKLLNDKKSDRIHNSGISLTGDLTFGRDMPSDIRSHQDTLSESKSSQSASGFSTKMASVKMDKYVQKSLRNVKPHSLGDMSNTVKELIARFYTGDLQLEVENNQLYVTVFDYGGHTAYRPSQTPFLSQKGLKLVVFKMSEYLEEDCSPSTFKCDDPDSSREWGNLCVTNWEVVEEWLSYVHVTAADNPIVLRGLQGSSIPPIILVATHIDEADEQLVKRQENFVVKQLKEKPYEKHIIPVKGHYVVGVDNTISGEGGGESVKYLKETIERIARDMKTTVHLRWVQLACAIMELRKMKPGTSQTSKPVVALEDLRYLADCLHLVSEDSDFKNAVEFLSDNGVIVSQPMQRTGTKNVMIIIDPQWLIKQFCKILTVHNRCKLDKSYLEDLDNLESKGILSYKFACHLLSDGDGEVILEYMEAYNLICPYQSTSHMKKCASRFGSDQAMDEDDDSRSSISENPAFFVPSMLRPCKPRGIERPLTRDSVTHLWFHLPKCRIPDQAFYQLLALLTKKYPLLPQLFYRKGIFNVSQGHRFHLVSEVRYLRLSVYINEKELRQKTKEVCNEVRKTIKRSLSDLIKKDLPGLRHLQRGIRPAALLEEGDVNFDFAVLKKKHNKTYYLRTDKGETIPMPDWLTLWFPEMQPEDTSGDSQGTDSPPVNKENNLKS